MIPYSDLNDQVNLVDRCIVCGSDNPDRMRRKVTLTYGGAAAEARFTVEYCADNPLCGEASAVWMIDQLASPFVAADLRRRHLSIMDLGVPTEEEL